MPDLVNNDDLTAALSDFDQLGPAWAPRGGGSMSNLVNAVATNPAYRGTLQPSISFAAFLPWGLGFGAFLLLLSAVKGRR